MENEISLSDYYNKMVQTQLSLKISKALEDEVFHHHRNGVLNLLSHMRLRHFSKEQQDVFYKDADALVKILRNKVDSQKKLLEEDEKTLHVHALPLTRIIDNPQSVTQSDFMALSAFNDEQMTLSDELRAIRKEAEIKLLKMSGLVKDDFNVEADPELQRYYQKLVEVQLSAKIAFALESDMKKHFGLIPEVTNLIVPIREQYDRLNVGAMRLLDLVTKPDIVTRENFIALSAFNDHLRTIAQSFGEIHTSTEISQLKSANRIPSDFTL